MAARVKVIDLAKELGVTSKDLIVALEGMGHKGVRAMTPVPDATRPTSCGSSSGAVATCPSRAKPKRAAKPKEVPAEAEALGEAAAVKPAGEAKEAAGKRS